MKYKEFMRKLYSDLESNNLDYIFKDSITVAFILEIMDEISDEKLKEELSNIITKWADKTSEINLEDLGEDK